MKKLLISLAFTLMFTGMFCSFPPSGHAQTHFWFDWTAVGDDGHEGLAFGYDMRRSTDSLSLINDWDNQAIVTGVPQPSFPGSADSVLIVSQPTGIVFYYAIKTVDESFNWSPISNIVSRFYPDVVAPAAIVDLRIRE